MLELIKKVPEGEAGETLTLSFDLRQKSRHRVELDSGREAAVMLPHGSALMDGDRLRSADGTIVQVAAAPERLSCARSDDPVLLARACYHLGNRHVALQVGEGWVRYQPDHVLDAMVLGLGLTVEIESAAFEPERGAYHGHSHADGETAGHSHDHDGVVSEHSHGGHRR